MATDDLGTIQDAAARSWNLDPTYFRAIGAVESGNNPATPNSPAGASGPMQVMPGTASDMGVTDPSDVVQNTFASAKYISTLLDKYKDPSLAAAAYNAGPNRVDDYLAGKGSLPDETIAYVPKVAQAYAQLTDSAAAVASPPPAPASYRVAAADPGTASDVAPSPAAPPSGSAGAPAADPFDVLQQAANAHAGAASGAGAPATATPPPAPSAPPSAPPSASGATGADPFSALVSAASRAGSSGAAPGAPAATPSATATPATAPPGFVSAPSGATPTAPPPEGQWHQGVLGNLFSGVSSRFENLAGRVAGLASDVDNAVPVLRSLDTSAGLDPTKMAATLKSDVAAADAAGAGSTAYSVGNLIGNIAATAPLVETGAGALGLIGDAAASALPEAATAIRAGTNLLTGGGNATGLAKYATAATSGAAKAVAAGAAAGTGTVAGNALLGGVLGPAVTAVGPNIGKFLTNSVQPISAAPAGVNQLLVRAGQGIAGATRAVAGTAPEDATAAGSAALPLSNRLAAPSAVPPAGSPNLIANQATPVAAGSSAATDASAAASTAAPPAVATAEAAAPTTTVNLGPSASATSAGNAGANSGASTASGFTPSDPPPEAVRLGIFSSPANAATVGKQIYDNYLAGGPNVAVASKIPGVQLTAAQATGNPMIALLERTRRGLNPTPFTMLDQANATARSNYAQSLIGTPDDLDAARSSLAALDAQAQPQVFGNQQPVSTQPLLDTVQKAVADNAGRPTVQAPLINVANQLRAITSDDGTALPSDLWNVRKFIGDMIAPRAAGTANDGQAAAAQLVALKPTIDATIEPGAPGFGSYLQQYRQASQPISAMEYLQSKFPTNAQGNVQLGSLDSFVKGINRSQAKSGYSPADDITDQQLQGLTDLRDDLRLAGNVDLGRARGSDTNDRLFTTSKVAGMMQGATPGVAGLLGGAVTGVATGSGLEGGLGAAAGRYVANKLSSAQINRLAAVKTGAEQALDNLLLNPYGR